MDWLRRMFDRPSDIAVPSTALDIQRRRHKALLTRADRAIKEAMDHADEVFYPPYRGPDRRHHSR